MNPRVSHALVAVAAFALGAASLHLVTLRAIAADERQLLERARAQAEQRPIDLDAIDRFAADLERRSAILSAKASREAARRVLAGMEPYLRTVVDSRQGVYDHDGFVRAERTLREGFAHHPFAGSLHGIMQAERAHGVSECYVKGEGRNPLEVDAECPFNEPERREAARRALAERR